MDEVESTKLFNEIYDKTNKSILIYITAKCKSTTDISDIFQDTYMELFKVISSKGIDYIKIPEAFVRRIAKQKIYKFYSVFEKLKMQIPFSNNEDDDNNLSIEDFKDNTVSIEEDFLFGERVEEVRNILMKKSPEIQKIFHLFYSLDVTIAEIALIMETNESNVKNKLYRTINEIRTTLAEKEEAVYG